MLSLIVGILVVKVRLIKEEDFIEIDLERDCLTFGQFLNFVCKELGIDSKFVTKVRKCPNTLIRNDRDVARLLNYQEIELVTAS